MDTNDTAVYSMSIHVHAELKLRSDVSKYGVLKCFESMYMPVSVEQDTNHVRFIEAYGLPNATVICSSEQQAWDLIDQRRHYYGN